MDSFTLVVAYACVAGVMAASMALLYRAGPGNAYLLDWSLAGVFFAASSVLVAIVVKFQVTHMLVLACINVFYIAGHCGILIGVRRHLGLRPRYDLLLALAVGVFALHALPYTQSAVTHRLLLFTPVVAAANLAAAWLLWRQPEGGAKASYLPLILLETGFTVQLILRAVYIVVAEPVHLTYFGSQFLQTFGALCVLLFLTIVTMCCALINTRQQEMALRRAAMTDALTGLLNRRALQDIGRDEFHHGRRTGTPPFLIAFDIDHFQAISDRYGRGVGDTAVCHVAALSARMLHGHGTMFRTGGEEFAVLLPGSALVDVHEVAQRVRDAVAASPLLVHGHIVRMTVSGGVAWCDPEDAQWEDTLHRAREALCHAKEHGGNRVSVHGMETRFWKPAGVAP